MVTATLVESEVVQGRRVVEALGDADIPIPAALWYYESEAGEWQLVLASPLVDKDGLRETYKKIQAVLEKQQIHLPLRRIRLHSPSDRLIRTIGKAIKTGPGISVIRFTNNVVDDVLIEDALIYRSS